MEFNIVVKGVRYQLRVYKEFRNEWDLIVDDKIVCDSRSHSICMERFISMIKDWGKDLWKNT